ncbi:MAG: NAD-glutamate dehydrogenase [Actinomycetota bacterium]|nr:NAD-glutamate dehydrogenase [Actinomycetota bacterium]
MSTIERPAGTPRNEVAIGGHAELRNSLAELADLGDGDTIDLYGAALSHWQLLAERPEGTTRVRVFNPDFEVDGWQCPHTVVELVTDDRPFLVDSVTNALDLDQHGVHLVVHPIVAVRYTDGEISGLDDPRNGAGYDSDAPINVSAIHVEFDRESELPLLDAIGRRIEAVLDDVAAAVADWEQMRDRALELGRALGEHPRPGLDDDDRQEAARFLEWLADDHYVFLGYREYDLDEGDHLVLRSLPETGLGILRADEPSVTDLGEEPTEVAAEARAVRALNLTKTNAIATVHRPARMDYVGVKKLSPEGKVVGEYRLLGLYTAPVYTMSPAAIPVVRRRVEAVLERSGYAPDTHNANTLFAAIENYPRDELFQVDTEELFEHALGIVHLGRRREVGLFVRRDRYGRFASCLVYIPRDRFTTEVRLRVQELLVTAFDGTEVEYTTQVSESAHARLHYTIHTRSPEMAPPDVADLQAQLNRATRAWVDDLHDALVDRLGEEAGLDLYGRYQRAFPPGYTADHEARNGVADLLRIEQLSGPDDLGLSLYRPLGAGRDQLRFKIYRRGRSIILSSVLPLLHNLGVRVVDERPYEIDPRDGDPAWIYDFGLIGDGTELPDSVEVRDRFQETFERVWRGDADDDSFNRLVLLAGLQWREIVMIRAYSRYVRQIGMRFSQSYIADTVCAHPTLARQLVELFHARFEPGIERDADHEVAVSGLRADIDAELDNVASLDQDRILRALRDVVLATVRTNYYQVDQRAEPKNYLALKLDPARVAQVPPPRPAHEVFVYSPRTEGVHLRSARVARGGLRWSDRMEDYRTEILDLMKAQVVKNAIIVPSGAKGGFVVKRPPAGGDRDALAAEVQQCYRTFISALLDVTGTYIGGEVSAPARVVRHDGDDPYLVVAADKGTATFSDVANEISVARNFWLGDAFASGGSTGYDHKAMGITARGAWESVKRHFRALDIDIQTTPVTVVGIGDMSGDVFGNGMLLSRKLRLVAAFDHRHVFLDPDPDPEASWEERRRLFDLPRSTWADYDPSLISTGGGVYPRTAKSIEVSHEAAEVLGIEVTTLTPAELVSAILRAPVDLLWNGGIGTYVRSSEETNADAGDKSNDHVRVTADRLRCRVVGEGGNLGLTQRARVEAARCGVRLFTDAIDNSAGVNTSDHEVNIKILLDMAVAEGDLTTRQRNELLASMTDEVAHLVLAANYANGQALANAVANAASMVDVHSRQMATLGDIAGLDPELEALPDAEDFADRRSAHQGLTAPELSVLLAYAKNALTETLVASDLPDDPWFDETLARYFPTAIRYRFRELMARHPLRRELIATEVANRIVERGGVTLVHRLSEETAAGWDDVARAHVAAWQVFSMERFTDEVSALDNRVDAATQTLMLLRGRRLVERATRWLLRNRRTPIDVGATVAEFHTGVEKLATDLDDLVADLDREDLSSTARNLTAAGAPVDLARRSARHDLLVSALDVLDVAAAIDCTAEEVAIVYFDVGERLHLGWLREKISDLPRSDRWESLARAALRDDLFREHAAMAREILTRGRTGSPSELVQGWLDRNPSQVERCRNVLDDIRQGDHPELAQLSVALRELRNLIQQANA